MTTFYPVRRRRLLTMLCLMSLSILPVTGCRSSGARTPVVAKHPSREHRARATETGSRPLTADGSGVIRLTAFDDETTGGPDATQTLLHDAESDGSYADALDSVGDPVSSPSTFHELSTLEAIAQSANPKLIRLQQEANAASAMTRHIDKLPDPTLGANVFGYPIETAAGSQRANLTLMQMIPWLERLDAQQQQACFEALALWQMYAAERLRVVGNVRAGYYRLYVLARQIETVGANQELLETLIEIVNARVATGNATQGDVLLGTLELSRLEVQLITLRQQLRSTQAEINRHLNREASIAIAVPDDLEVFNPDWTHEMLVQSAFERQPVIVAAQLQANASRWGVSVAELRRRPDLQIGAAWFFIEDNRPPTNVVDVGRDAWSLGATISLPLDRQKYDAIHDEALWKNAASHSNVEDTRREFEARLLDLLEQARAAYETASLYRDTIIPQSEQTLAADQESLANGTVEFDRVIQDFRNLLTLEFGYHRSVGQLATAIARIQQAVGFDLEPKTPT